MWSHLRLSLAFGSEATRNAFIRACEQNDDCWRFLNPAYWMAWSLSVLAERVYKKERTKARKNRKPKENPLRSLHRMRSSEDLV